MAENERLEQKLNDLWEAPTKDHVAILEYQEDGKREVEKKAKVKRRALKRKRADEIKEVAKV